MVGKSSVDRLSLSVFFPCYNEEANVERTVRSALTHIPSVADDFEIIIVDDGSTDSTGDIADRLAAEHERVRAVHNKPNLGYGRALQRGFRESCKEWVFYTDGDGQFDIGEMRRLLPLLGSSDIISAYRLNRQDPALRKLNGWAWTMLVNLMLGLRVKDVDCAFKLFPRELFDRIEMKSSGALIDAEILARAKRLGYTIGQIGVQHYPRRGGEQTGANLRVILRAFKELLLLRGDIRRTTRRNKSAAI